MPTIRSGAYQPARLGALYLRNQSLEISQKLVWFYQHGLRISTAVFLAVHTTALKCPTATVTPLAKGLNFRPQLAGFL